MVVLLSLALAGFADQYLNAIQTALTNDFHGDARLSSLKIQSGERFINRRFNTPRDAPDGTTHA
jgi:hypothetical protein